MYSTVTLHDLKGEIFINILSRIHSKHKIIICSAVLGAAVFALNISAFASTYTDIGNCPDYAKSAIASLDEKKIISGAGNGKFYPDSTATRAETITVIAKALNLDTTSTPDVPDFKDVPKDHWAYRFVEAAYREGIIKGTGQNIFGVNDLCTREQMAKMLVNALNLPEEKIQAQGSAVSELARFEDRNRISEWAVNAVSFAVHNKIMSGTSTKTFSPDLPATREQMAVVIDRYLKSEIKAPEEPSHTTFIQLSLSNQNGDSQLIFSSLKPIEGASVESITDKNGKVLKHGAPFIYKDYFVTYTNILDTGNCLREELLLFKSENPSKDEFIELVKGETYTVRYSYRLKGESTVIHAQEDVVVPLDNNYVESVIPINASQLRIRFYRGVSSASATDLSSYKITDENGSEVRLKNVSVSADSRFAVLNLSEPNVTPKIVNMTIKNVITLSSDNSLISPYSGNIPLDDRDKPVIEKLDTANDDKNFTSVTLTFNEPVYSGTILINNIPFGQAAGEVVTIPGLSFDGTKSLQVDVLNLSDGVNITKAASIGKQRLFDPPKRETIPPVLTNVTFDKDNSGRAKNIILTFNEGLKAESGYPASLIKAFDKDNIQVEAPLKVIDQYGNPVKTDEKILCYTSEKVEEGSTRVVFPLAEGVNIYSGKYTFYFPKDLVNDIEGNGNEASAHVIDFGTLASSGNK